MKNLYFLLTLIPFLAFSQIQNDVNFYKEIPLKYLNHPELKTSKNQSSSNESKYELIHERTKFSKTFLNTNTTKTTIQSSTPLHYEDKNGFWLSIDYKLTSEKNNLVFPSNTPTAKYNKDSENLTLFNNDKNIQIEKDLTFTFVGNNLKIEKSNEKKSKKNNPKILNENELLFENYINEIDKKYTFYNNAIKSDYIIKDKTFFPNSNFNELIMSENITVPNGFRIEEIKNENQKVNQLNVIDSYGKIYFTYHQPIISDAKVISLKSKSTFKPYEASYKVLNNSNNSFTIQTIIDGDWLNSNERVFPITIDPVVSITNNDNINSCFFPNYQQNTLQVAVPAGETIFSTNIYYDFIATASSDAYMSEQRSFVSSVSGQTNVLNGVGETPGSYTYNINNSPIANSTSTGTVNFTFNFSRTWGGSDCNATFQFVNRRQVAVTYGTIVFGNGPIFINEYSASNRSVNDSYGRTEDWIEIFNSNPNTYFNLTGFYLSNDQTVPTKWQIQNGLIPPNSSVIVYCSRRNLSSGTFLHANFNLTQLRPDKIILANPQGVVMEQLDMFVTQTNHSYGRATNGGSTWKVFTTATPGASNNVGFDNYTSKPTFSVQAGRYQNSVTFALASTGTNEQIRYTTNGSTPTISSTLYTAPVTLNATTVVRARAFSSNPNIIPGFIETNTYFINENSILPVFSFAGDPNLLQLFNGNQSLEPIANFEYFQNNGAFVDENLGDFDKHGNDSWNYAQRGVDFTSRDDHGYKRRLEHQFFATSNRTRFSKLMVKASASDNYPFETGGAHIRDAYIQTLSQVAGLDLDERSSTSINLFVNGQYWGVYDLRERVDDNDYTDFYYGQDATFRESDIHLQYLKTWGDTEAEYGNQPAITAWSTLRQYIQNNNMGTATNFNFVDSQLNIDSLIDYFVINSIVVSRDWLNYNTGWWRGTDPAGQAKKWRYTLWDMDAALGHYTNFTGMPNVTATANPCQVENLNVGDGHTQILRKLILENPVVRQKYVTRYADLLNTSFSCSNLTQFFDLMVAKIAPEMPRQLQRWGGNMTTWQSNVQAAKTFITTRCAYLMSTGISTCYNLTGPFATNFNVVPANAGKIKMNSTWLSQFPFTAQVFGNIKTLLKAEANPGFTFSHWVVDGAVIVPNATNIDIELMLSQATTVTAHFIDPSATGGNLLYYWHFNTLETPTDVTSIPADYKLITTTNPMMTYTGTGPRDIDMNTSGSSLNLHLGELAGKNARVRNPSDNRSLVFNLPTTGYRDIRFVYAVERTTTGQLKNIISYSLDGTNFIQTGLTNTEFDVQTTASLIQVDFTAITGVNNNPNFRIRIVFQGNTVATNGNNRLDNITLKGIANPLSVKTFTQTNLQLIPNPFDSNVQVISSESIKSVGIYDVLGKLVFEKQNIDQNQVSFDLSELNSGIYIVNVASESGVETKKLVKK